MKTQLFIVTFLQKVFKRYKRMQPNNVILKSSGQRRNLRAEICITTCVRVGHRFIWAFSSQIKRENSQCYDFYHFLRKSIASCFLGVCLQRQLDAEDNILKNPEEHSQQSEYRSYFSAKLKIQKPQSFLCLTHSESASLLYSPCYITIHTWNEELLC